MCTYLVEFTSHRPLQLLFHKQHHILHIPARNHFQRNPDRFPLDLHIGAIQHFEDIHHHAVQHTIMLGAQRVKSVQHDELDVVVGFFDDELDECAGGG